MFEIGLVLGFIMGVFALACGLWIVAWWYSL